jgi:hypothetical protein
VQLATPDVESLPLNDTSTGWLYQPFASGLLEGVAVTAGDVASYLSAYVVGALWFPATSVHVPPTVAPPVSGPEYVIWEHDAIPDVGSIPVKVILTGELNQPPPFGARSGEAPATVGLSVSILNAR